MASLVPLFSVRKKISSKLLSISFLTSWNYIFVALLPLHIVLNLILATNPVILSLLCALWLCSLTGYFFICPTDLLIRFCSSELHKLLTHPTLFLQSCCRLCCVPWVTHSERTVREQCCLPRFLFFYLFTWLTISVYKCTLPLISLVLSFSFLTLQRFCVIYLLLQSKRAKSYPLKQFWIKQFTPVFSSLSVIYCHPYPAISVFLSPVGFFSLFILSWCTGSSIEELIWTTNNFVLFHVK